MVTPSDRSSREVQAHLALHRILLSLAEADGRRTDEEARRLATRRQLLDFAGVPEAARTPISADDPLTAAQRVALEQECHQMGEILLSFAGADGMAARERVLMRELAEEVGALFSERVSDLLAAQGAAQRRVRSAARVDRKHGSSLRFLRWTSVGLVAMVVALGVTAVFIVVLLAVVSWMFKTGYRLKN